MLALAISAGLHSQGLKEKMARHRQMVGSNRRFPLLKATMQGIVAVLFMVVGDKCVIFLVLIGRTHAVAESTADSVCSRRATPVVGVCIQQHKAMNRASSHQKAQQLKAQTSTHLIDLKHSFSR